MTADEPSGSSARERGSDGGQVFPALTDGCQRTGACTPLSGLLQIRLPRDVETFEDSMCSQTQLNGCAGSSCLNLQQLSKVSVSCFLLSSVLVAIVLPGW